MASQTTFLKLTLPLNNEYVNTWDQPNNDNFEKIDIWANAINLEVVNARFGQVSIAAFLAVAHETDGTLKPTEEVSSSRNSQVYGDEDEDENDLELPQRLNLGDREVSDAREGYPTLRDALAARMLTIPSQILSGKKNVNGYPTWLGFTGADAQVDGSGADPLMMLIDGKLCRIRTLKQLTLSGGAGTKYIYAQFQAAGQVTVDGDSGTPPPATPNGVTGSDGDKFRIFSDATQDFTAEDVQVGDLLTILGAGADAGEYFIREVAPLPLSDVTQLKIVGIFPQGGLSSLNYTITDQLAVTLGFDTAEVPAAGKLYIGEADFDGAAITAVRARYFKDTFVGEWRAVDVGGSPTFEEIWNHTLGSDLLDVSVQVSQANDGTAAVEELSQAILGNDQLFSFVNTQSFDPGAWDPGTTDADYSPLPSLTGTVSSSLTGSYYMERSVFTKWTKNQINVKNAVSAKFYRDYAGAVKTTGFIRVVIRKRG